MVLCLLVLQSFLSVGLCTPAKGLNTKGRWDIEPSPRIRGKKSFLEASNILLLDVNNILSIPTKPQLLTNSCFQKFLPSPPYFSACLSPSKLKKCSSLAQNDVAMMDQTRNLPIDWHTESLVSRAVVFGGGTLGKVLDRRALTSLIDWLIYW